MLGTWDCLFIVLPCAVLSCFSRLRLRHGSGTVDSRMHFFVNSASVQLKLQSGYRTGKGCTPCTRQCLLPGDKEERHTALAS